MKSYFLIYLAVLGLGCGTRDLRSLLQHVGSLVVVGKLLVAACEPLVVACGTSSLTRDQTWTPALGAWCPSHWTTRLVPPINIDWTGQENCEILNCHLLLDRLLNSRLLLHEAFPGCSRRTSYCKFPFSFIFNHMLFTNIILGMQVM